jgi:hypothetical protein
MLECRNKYHIHNFDIEDDNFTFDKERAKRLMSLVVETFGEQTLELSAMNGVSFASLDGDLLGLMKRAGFKTINLSFVSTDPSFKERMGRPGTTEVFDKVLGEAGRPLLMSSPMRSWGFRSEDRGDVGHLDLSDGEKSASGSQRLLSYSWDFSFEQCKAKGLLPPHPSQWRSSALPIETKISIVWIRHTFPSGKGHQFHKRED